MKKNNVNCMDLMIEEVALSDTNYLTVRGRSTNGKSLPKDLSVVLDSTVVGQADVCDTNQSFSLFCKISAQYKVSHQSELSIISEHQTIATSKVYGKIGASSDIWFADETWTSFPKPLEQIATKQPTIILFGSVLPDEMLDQWLKVAGFCSMMRAAKIRLVYLCNANLQLTSRYVSELLEWFDIVHCQHSDAISHRWNPQYPGAFPNSNRRQEDTLKFLVESSNTILVVACSPEATVAFKNLPEQHKRAVLIPRSYARAPSMIFAAVPRHKAAVTLNAALFGALPIVEDNGLAIEIQKWMKSEHPISIDFCEAAVEALRNRKRTKENHIKIVDLSDTLPQIEDDLENSATSILDENIDFKTLVHVLSKASSITMNSADNALNKFTKYFGLKYGIDVFVEQSKSRAENFEYNSDDAKREELVKIDPKHYSSLALLTESNRKVILENIIARLGLVNDDETIESSCQSLVLLELLNSKLGQFQDRDRVGLLIDSHHNISNALMTSFESVVGAGKVFSMQSKSNHSFLPSLADLRFTRIDTLLYDAPDAKTNFAMMEKIVSFGVDPVPLSHRAIWKDYMGLAGIKNICKGADASILFNQKTSHMEVALSLDSKPSEEIVVLSNPADKRRGKLGTLFFAQGDLFRKRPSGRVIGFDGHSVGLKCGIEEAAENWSDAAVALLLVMYLGCSRVLIATKFAGGAGMEESIAAVRAVGVEVNVRN